MDRFDEMRGKNGNGGGGTIIVPPEAGELTGIIISNMPKKLDYTAGDSFDVTGLEVTGVYENNVYTVITGACKVTVNDPLTVHDTSVLISYEGFEEEIEINVYGKSLEIPDTAIYLFPFDDSNTNALDTADTCSVSSYTEGKFLKSAYISSNFRISKTPTPSQIMGGSKATIEFWCYVSGAGEIFSYGLGGMSGVANETMGFALNYWDTILQFHSKHGEYGSKSNRIEAQSLTGTLSEALTGSWHHFAICFDGRNLMLFVDGIAIINSVIPEKPAGSTSYPTVYDSSNLIRFNTAMQIDELLICTTNLYTANFSIPGGAYGGEKVLQKIYIDKLPKTTYQSGEEFSLSEANIIAVFSNGLITSVTDECVIEGDLIVTTKDTYKTISYTFEDVTKKISINIGVYTIEPTLDLSATKLLINFDGNVTDLTGLNSPTVVGNDLYGEGKFGMARYFNGTTDYISIPYTNDINIDTGDFTIAFWIKPLDTSIGCAFFSIGKYIASNAVMGLRIGINNDSTFFCNASQDSSGTTLTINNHTTSASKNTWIHLATIRKDNVLTFYVDGKKTTSVEYSDTLYTGSSELHLGARSAYSSGMEWYYNGYIDDLIITKSALWDSEFDPPTKPYSEM